MKKSKRYNQLALIMFHNGGEFLYEMKSNKLITIERVWEYFEETESISEDRDSIIFIEGISKIDLDKGEKRLNKNEKNN